MKIDITIITTSINKVEKDFEIVEIKIEEIEEKIDKPTTISSSYAIDELKEKKNKKQSLRDKKQNLLIMVMEKVNCCYYKYTIIYIFIIYSI
jgi:hypothetical protein